MGQGWTGPADWDDPDDDEVVAQARKNILDRLERIRQRDEKEKLDAGWTRDGDGWVPPGWAPVAEAKALPELVEKEAEGPRVRIQPDVSFGRKADIVGTGDRE